MKLITAIILIGIVMAVMVSGCIQQKTGTQQQTGTGGDHITGEHVQVEDQASQALEEELDQALENMTMEDLENELLSQS